MSNIIELSKFKKRDGDKPVWLADLSIFQTEDQYSARIISAAVDLGLPDADMLRKIAECLETVAFIARQQAEEYEESDAGSALAVFTVFKNGSVKSRLDEANIVSPEQFSWAADCLDLMSNAVRRMEV